MATTVRPSLGGANQDSAVSLAEDISRLHAAMAAVAGRLLVSVPFLTLADKQFLWDLARDECRYPMRTLARLLGIARRSPDAAERQAFPEHLRSIVRSSLSNPDLATVFDRETESTGPADVAERALERHLSPETLAAADQALACQLAATRDALDAVRDLETRSRPS